MMKHIKFEEKIVRAKACLITLFIVLFSLMGLTSCGFHAPTTAEEFNPTEHSDHRVDLASANSIVELYQMMKDTHEVFTQCHLQYWADSGTLLGAIRNQGIIPWDDDNDTAILYEDAPKLLALRPILDELGYQLEKVFFGYRIVKDHSSAQVDIFLMKERNGYYYYDRGDWGSRNILDPVTGISTKTSIYLKPEEIFPLQTVNFGPIRVQIPHHPIPYLDAMYRGWDNFAFTYGHEGQRKFKIDLNRYSYFRQPAPLDPVTFQTVNVQNLIQPRVSQNLNCPEFENYHQHMAMPIFYDGI